MNLGACAMPTFQPKYQPRRSPIERLMPIAIVVGCALVVFACAGAVVAGGSTPPMRRDSATENATAYALDLGWQPNASCSSQDNDGHGYVPCTVANRDGVGREPIECSYDVFIAPFGQETGCRVVGFAPIGVGQDGGAR